MHDFLDSIVHEYNKINSITDIPQYIHHGKTTTCSRCGYQPNEILHLHFRYSMNYKIDVGTTILKNITIYNSDFKGYFFLYSKTKIDDASVELKPLTSFGANLSLSHMYQFLRKRYFHRFAPCCLCTRLEL